MYSTTMLLSTRLYFLLGIVSLSSLTAVFSFDIDSTIVDNPSLPVVSRDRALQGTAVTTSACDNIRTQRFPAKLELVYFYVLETTNGPLEDLSGIQNAILRAVLEALQRCDGNGFPEFALDLATKHEYSENGTLLFARLGVYAICHNCRCFANHACIRVLHFTGSRE